MIKKVYGKGLSPTELCMRNGLVSVARATVANRHFCAIYARRIIHIKGYGGDEGIQCELKRWHSGCAANNNREEDMKKLLVLGLVMAFCGGMAYAADQKGVSAKEGSGFIKDKGAKRKID